MRRATTVKEGSFFRTDCHTAYKSMDRNRIPYWHGLDNVGEDTDDGIVLRGGSELSFVQHDDGSLVSSVARGGIESCDADRDASSLDLDEPL